jgi:hypothetical protein
MGLLIIRFAGFLDRWENQLHSRLQLAEIAETVDLRHVQIIFRISINTLTHQRQRIARFNLPLMG